MDLATAHQRCQDLKDLMRNRGYCYGVECCLRINWTGDELCLNVTGRLTKEDGTQRSKYIHGFLSDPEPMFMEAAEVIYAWPDTHTQRVEQLTKKLGEIAELCEGGACQQDAYQATWDALQQMMRRQQDFISKNGLPAPRHLDHMTDVHATE